MRREIVVALKQTEVSTPVRGVRRKMGISDATFYHWRKKYGKLKRLVGDLPVDQAMLQDDLSCASRDLI